MMAIWEMFHLVAPITTTLNCLLNTLSSNLLTL